MSTNYYVRKIGVPSSKLNLHIGKSSLGWTFQLRIYPELHIESLEDWEAFLNKPLVRVYDEYDKRVHTGHFLEIVTNRYWNGPQGAWSDEKFRQEMGPYAERGPRGLSRSKVDGERCIGHAPNNETWDLIIGEFS